MTGMHGMPFLFLQERRGLSVLYTGIDGGISCAPLQGTPQNKSRTFSLISLMGFLRGHRFSNFRAPHSRNPATSVPDLPPLWGQVFRMMFLPMASGLLAPRVRLRRIGTVLHRRGRPRDLLLLADRDHEQCPHP